MTFTNPTDALPRSNDRSAFADRFDEVLTAGGRKAAVTPEQGADEKLVAANAANEQSRWDLEQLFHTTVVRLRVCRIKFETFG